MLKLFDRVLHFLRRFLFFVVSYGPMPEHIAFIMDGNRRFSNRRKLKQGSGHRVGYSALVSTLQYCYEMGVKYVTVYAFSIDNFKRKADEVEGLMDLMLEKIEEMLEKESIVKKYGVRVKFLGNLMLLHQPVRLAAEKTMAVTAENTGPVLSICVAYTSTDEITNAVDKSCREKVAVAAQSGCHGGQEEGDVSVKDIERHLYTNGCPEPDIVLRTSGESRLSNFLLWQTRFSHLQNQASLWPEFSLRHLIWSILEYQRVYPYLQRRRK